MAGRTWLRNTVCASFALATALPACSSDTSCDGSGRAAIVVSVKDAAGGLPICNATVRFVGPETDQTVDCQPSCGADCGSLYADGARSYTVEAHAPGYLTTSKTVFVPRGDCDKPVTQHVTLELESGCTSPMQPAPAAGSACPESGLVCDVGSLSCWKKLTCGPDQLWHVTCGIVFPDGGPCC
jgi:hypothetical protein